MSKDAGKANAQVHLAKANIETSTAFSSINGRSLRFPPAVEGYVVQGTQVFPPNPAMLSLYVYTPCGWFSGSATLRDSMPSNVVRTVRFSGLLKNGTRKGCGYFIVPTLPNANSPLLSGQLDLSEVPSFTPANPE